MKLKQFYRYVFGFLLLVFVFTGCGSNNGGGVFVQTSSKIKLLSPQEKSTIDYNYVTLEVKDNVADVKAKVNGVEYIGVKNKSSFLIYNVALKKGKNIIELIADNSSEEHNVTISSEGKGYPPISINTDKREGFEKLDTTLTVQTKLNVSKYLLDSDNDGVIDEDKTNNSFTLKYTKEGRYFPTATVKISDGTLYSTQQNLSLDVKAKPTVKALSDLSGLSVIDMQTYNHEKYYVFAKDNNVYKIDPKTNKIIQTIPVVGVNNADGFFVDIEENIFIANTGANQILKLSKADNYQQSILVNKAGSGDGELNQPKDLVVDSNHDNGRVYVLDAGNNRVQVFDGLGKYLYAFDGSTTPTGKLKNPTSMIGYFGQPLTIVDSGNGAIRTLQCSQGQKEHEVSVIKDGISSNIGQITMGGNLIVPDKGAKKILFFQNNYWLKKSLGVDKVPNIALSNDGLTILVANEGESGLKKYKIKEDPKGAEPMDVAKKFVKYIINKNKIDAKELLINEDEINIIFSDNNITQNYITFFKHISSWKETINFETTHTIIAHIKIKDVDIDYAFILDKEHGVNSWLIRKFD